MDFKTKATVRPKEEHYIMIKGTIQLENIPLVNTYAPNIGAPTYVKHILMDIQGETDSNTVLVRGFNTPFTSMARSSRQKINKETAALNDTLDQTALIAIFRAFYPKAAECTFFSSAHGTFSRIDHMLGHTSQYI